MSEDQSWNLYMKLRVWRPVLSTHKHTDYTKLNVHNLKLSLSLSFSPLSVSLCLSVSRLWGNLSQTLFCPVFVKEMLNKRAVLTCNSFPDEYAWMLSRTEDWPA